MTYKNKYQFKTWDFFQLAFPFNTIIIDYGDLIEIKDDENIKKINSTLEKSLNKMTRINDREVKNYKK